MYELTLNLDINKSAGSDGISAKFLKEAGISIVPSLTKLFNLSLSECQVPTVWKKANVIPMHKKDSKMILRAIALYPYYQY